MFTVRYRALQHIYRDAFEIRTKFTATIKAVFPAQSNIRPLVTYTKVDPEKPFLNITELQKVGSTTDTSYTLDELTSFLKNDGFNLQLPPRDLKLFFRTEVQSMSSNSVLVRPNSKCFLLELEQLKLICFPDKCLVLNSDNRVVADFLNELKKNCLETPPAKSKDEVTLDGKAEEREEKCVRKSKSPSQEFHSLLVNNIQHMDFEHIVLEQALDNITSRFTRHISLTKPALELLLQKITQRPSGSMLRRLLAFRKSLGDFELNVRQVKHVIDELLRNEADMVALYLTCSCRELHQHTNVKRLLEAYTQDLVGILNDIQSLRMTVDETNQFIDTHLSSVRNRMIEIGIFMDMGTLSLGVGACAAGIFGMNLQHGIEEHPYAFFVVSGSLVTIMTLFCGGFFRKYYRTVGDTSSAHSFKALKNFFQYVDELDAIVEAKGQHHFTRWEFQDILNKLTGTKVTEEESKFIFQMFDADKDGVLKREEIRLGDDSKHTRDKQG